MTHVTPSRRAVIRTAAWTVPAVTVATAAPAFAASGAPNLSGTSFPTPVRDGGKLSFTGVSMSNSGGTRTEGITFTFVSTGATITDITAAAATPVSAVGMTLSGLGTNTVTMTIPASSGFNVNGGSSVTIPVPINIIVSSTSGAVSIAYTVAALNTVSGTPATGTITVAGTPDLSTTALAPTRTAGSSNISVPGFTITNTGAVDTVGITFTFALASGVINRISAAGMNAHDFQGMAVSGTGTGTAVLTLPANFFGRNATANGGTMSVPVALALETNGSTPTTLNTTIVATNGGVASKQTFASI